MSDEHAFNPVTKKWDGDEYPGLIEATAADWARLIPRVINDKTKWNVFHVTHGSAARIASLRLPEQP